MQPRQQEEKVREVKEEININKALEKPLQDAAQLLEKNPKAGGGLFDRLANLDSYYPRFSNEKKLQVIQGLHQAVLEALSSDKENETKDIPYISTPAKIQSSMQSRYQQIEASIQLLSVKNPEGAKVQTELLNGLKNAETIRPALLDDFHRNLQTQIAAAVSEVKPCVLLGQAVDAYGSQNEEKAAPMSAEKKEELSQLLATRLRVLEEVQKKISELKHSLKQECVFLQIKYEPTAAGLQKLDDDILRFEAEADRLYDDIVRRTPDNTESLFLITVHLKYEIKELLINIGKETEEFVSLNLITQADKDAADEKAAETIKEAHASLDSAQSTALRHNIRVLKNHLLHIQSLKKTLHFMAEKMEQGGSLIANLTLYSSRQETAARYNQFLRLLEPLQEGLFNPSSTFHYATYTQNALNLDAFVAQLKVAFSEKSQQELPAVFTENAAPRVSKTKRALRRLKHKNKTAEKLNCNSSIPVTGSDTCPAISSANAFFSFFVLVIKVAYKSTC